MSRLVKFNRRIAEEVDVHSEMRAPVRGEYLFIVTLYLTEFMFTIHVSVKRRWYWHQNDGLEQYSLVPSPGFPVLAYRDSMFVCAEFQLQVLQACFLEHLATTS